jgi:hypothetical protein
MRFVTADPVYLDAAKKQVPRLFQEYPKWVFPAGGDGVLVNDADEEARVAPKVEITVNVLHATGDIADTSEVLVGAPELTSESDETKPAKRKPGRPRKNVE